MICALLAMLTSVFGGVNQTQSATRPADTGTQLAVMTFNIRLGTAKDGENDWQHRRDILYRVLRDHKPDLVGLQEAYKFQIDDIIGACPAYAFIGVSRDDGQAHGEFSSILYNKQRLRLLEQDTFWLSETPEVPGSKSWDTAYPRVCTWGRFEDRLTGRKFYHFNTHLDHISQLARERGIELIARRMKERKHPDPAFLTGDFNAGEDNTAVRYLKGDSPRASTTGPAPVDPPKLVDTFRALHADQKVVGTFNGWRGKSNGPKIDYIFAPPEIRVIEADILHDNRDGRYPSDHYPLITIVDWPRTSGDR